MNPWHILPTTQTINQLNNDLTNGLALTKAAWRRPLQILWEQRTATVVVLTFVLQMMAIYLLALQTFLTTTTMTPGDLLLCVAASSLVLVTTEVEKYFARQRSVV